MTTTTTYTSPLTPRAIIETILALQGEGLSRTKIAAKLNDAGHTTATGLDWTERRVRAVLAKRALTGRPRSRRAPEERFDARLLPAEDGHIIWTGERHPQGYGTFRIDDTTPVLAQRYAWEREHGPIPEGERLFNTCGEKLCVNSEHWTIRDFESFVQPDDDSTCLVWTGNVNAKGYGVWIENRARRFAHRVAYVSHYGAIPEGYNVHHLCGTRNCVNVHHLTAVAPEKHGELAKDETAIAAALEDGALYVELAVHSALDDGPEHPARIGALETPGAVA